MPRLEYFVAAESIAIDQTTNRVSIFNVVEELIPGPGPFPKQIPSVVTIACIDAQEGDEQQDYQATLRIHGAPMARELLFPLNFRFVSPRQRLAHRVDMLNLAGPGVLLFELQLNGNHFAEHRVTVQAARLDPVAAAAPESGAPIPP